MLIHNPKLPAFIDAEIRQLESYSKDKNVQKLRERRFNANTVGVEIYYHKTGTDLYFCDVRRSYYWWSVIVKEASVKINRGRLLYLALIENQSKANFISSVYMPTPISTDSCRN